MKTWMQVGRFAVVGIAVFCLPGSLRAIPQDFGNMGVVVLPAPFVSATWETAPDRALWKPVDRDSPAPGAAEERLLNARPVSAFGLAVGKAEMSVKEGRMQWIRFEYPKRDSDDFHLLRATIEAQTGAAMNPDARPGGVRVAETTHHGVRVDLSARPGRGVELKLSRVAAK